MHEATIAEALIQQVRAVLDREGLAGRVRSVEVAVGALSGVLPDALDFAFVTLSAGTFLEGAELVLRSVPGDCLCRACGQKSPAEDLLFQCPLCGSPEITLQGGHELRLEAIELDDQASDG
ncbi:MAG: hydrogenase maturation nickel metallochaperone HypA [Thermoguttaceae bacterium]|nr:hydrogenase maturation nickel metallochaperone HypA [Thermoguttaceae bacterium]MDW8078190.1 hydrogenase maturation nickel metallochaperone HypA [Thermoguttaceae bacterium]